MDAEELARRIDGARPSEVRRGIADLIASGSLAPGEQLPTIRDVAAALGVSAGSVSGSWAELQRDGLLVTRRRGGTRVAAPADRLPPPHRDLIAATPDPALLPDLASALEAATRGERGHATTGLLPELRRAAGTRWPYPPAALLAAPGVRAALHLVLTAFMAADAPVATVDPLCRRTAEVLRRRGGPVIPVAEDDEGPLPDSLAGALAAGARLFCFEPALSVPTGSTLSATRSEQLAAVIAAGPPGVRVFEEQTAAGLAPAVSLGSLLPERVLSAASYSRAFGGDLSVALLSGPADDIAVLSRLQDDEGGQAGVLAQRMLARLLVDRSAATAARRAAAVYARRNHGLREALHRRGVAARGAGFFLWVPVRDEPAALALLAERGIRASAGSRSRLVAAAAPHLRVATTRAPDDAAGTDRLSRLLAEAAAAS